MLLKPKMSVGNPKALLYKRFIDIQQSNNLQVVYKTFADNKYWIFDAVDQKFTNIDSTLVPSGLTPKIIYNNTTFLQYQSIYFKYNGTEWISTTDTTGVITLLSATFNNIGKYQTNKYYFAGSFDYMVKGTIEGTTTQYIKGNIIPLTSLNIKYYTDDISLSPDDLVVVDKQLYSVENPETIQKRMPKAYKIHFATLNSIL